MKSHSNVEIRRCRPLLGSFVEITASGSDGTGLHEAANAAFAAIERIQHLMSVHDPASEVSLLNREAASRAMTVSRETFEVLRRADRMASASGGAFDFTVAPTLARWGFLPASLRREKSGGWRDVVLMRKRQVRFLHPLALDLGGIAKGFAVDLAIDALRKSGVTAAVVNAGGDLRAFGPKPVEVHLRHPQQPQTFARKIPIQNAALATSSPYFTESNWRGQRISHLVQPHRRSAITGKVSVTVCAGECWLADALTKIVLNAPQLAADLLPKYEAQAIVLTA